MKTTLGLSLLSCLMASSALGQDTGIPDGLRAARVILAQVSSSMPPAPGGIQPPHPDMTETFTPKTVTASIETQSGEDVLVIGSIQIPIEKGARLETEQGVQFLTYGPNHRFPIVIGDRTNFLGTDEVWMMHPNSRALFQPLASIQKIEKAKAEDYSLYVVVSGDFYVVVDVWNNRKPIPQTIVRCFDPGGNAWAWTTCEATVTGEEADWLLARTAAAGFTAANLTISCQSSPSAATSCLVKATMPPSRPTRRQIVIKLAEDDGQRLGALLGRHYRTIGNLLEIQCFPNPSGTRTCSQVDFIHHRP